MEDTIEMPEFADPELMTREQWVQVLNEMAKCVAAGDDNGIKAVCAPVFEAMEDAEQDFLLLFLALPTRGGPVMNDKLTNEDWAVSSTRCSHACQMRMAC